MSARWFVVPGQRPLAALRALRIGSNRLHPAPQAADGPVVLFDTFDGQVAAAGRVLLGDARGLMLLGGPQGPVWQDPAVPGFVADMADGPVRAALGGIVSPLRRLCPIGEARLLRQPLALRDDLDKTRVRCDLLALDAGGRRAVALLRAQALRGYGPALARLAEGLHALGAVERLDAPGVIATLFPERQEQFARPAIAMAPDTTAFRVATDIIRAHIALARRTEPGIIDDIDSEFLHDHRVALRKVRSVLSLFKGVYGAAQTDDLKARFAALMTRTGRLRDLDVYLIERPAYLAMVPETVRPGLGLLFEAFAAERAAEHRDLSDHLQGDAHAREMRRLARLFDKPDARLVRGPMADRAAGDFARRLIWKRYRRVCAIAASIDDRTPDAQVHALRIQCKKLRYLLEFFAPMFPTAEVRPLIRALKKLQDVLGTFNDCAVQQAALAGRLQGLEAARGARKLEMAKGIGALLTVLDQRQRDARARVVASFAAFDAPATQAGFRALFKTAKASA
ncbi:CHAD domain-containing protein [Rhodobaculum claviforme]|uniref:CHAD domain-containing protein n=1 Tax=Rhodobaculum claviforme TaxID=1549854 RepID=A0A934TKW8_9RHOB|nr:CHAD domain-containing protein [Rhodobaculum claviforme]MBK5927670.1 hypothetical protein [Rhodobaculum claviforme]